MRGRRQAGTDIRREIDMAALAKGLERPGLDPRTWMVHGTVASVGGVDGAPDFADENAVLVSPSGVEVDVVVGVDNAPLTCRYGASAGKVTELAPIHPGDHVLVGIPDGDLANGGDILAILAGPHTPLPVGGDRLPLFKNDRYLLHAKGVPVDILTDSGSRVLIDEDGAVSIIGPGHIELDSDDVRLAAADADQQFVRGTFYRQQQATLNQAQITALQTLVAAFATWTGDPTTPAFLTAFPSTGVVIGAIGTAVAALLPALQTFEGQASQYLSTKVRGK